MGDLRATYDVHLRLIGKHVVNFILVIIELFSLDSTTEALRANIDLKIAVFQRRDQLGPKFQVEGVVPHQLLFVSEN